MGDDQRIGTVANFVISALGPAFAVRSLCVRRKVREWHSYHSVERTNVIRASYSTHALKHTNTGGGNESV